MSTYTSTCPENCSCDECTAPSVQELGRIVEPAMSSHNVHGLLGEDRENEPVVLDTPEFSIPNAIDDGDVRMMNGSEKLPILLRHLQQSQSAMGVLGMNSDGQLMLFVNPHSDLAGRRLGFEGDKVVLFSDEQEQDPCFDKVSAVQCGTLAVLMSQSNGTHCLKRLKPHDCSKGLYLVTVDKDGRTNFVPYVTTDPFTLPDGTEGQVLSKVLEGSKLVDKYVDARNFVPNLTSLISRSTESASGSFEASLPNVPENVVGVRVHVSGKVRATNTYTVAVIDVTVNGVHFASGGATEQEFGVPLNATGGFGGSRTIPVPQDQKITAQANFSLSNGAYAPVGNYDLTVSIDGYDVNLGG